MSMFRIKTDRRSFLGWLFGSEGIWAMTKTLACMAAGLAVGELLKYTLPPGVVLVICAFCMGILGFFMIKSIVMLWRFRNIKPVLRSCEPLFQESERITAMLERGEISQEAHDERQLSVARRLEEATRPLVL